MWNDTSDMTRHEYKEIQRIANTGAICWQNAQVDNTMGTGHTSRYREEKNDDKEQQLPEWHSTSEHAPQSCDCTIACESNLPLLL
jgi:hypothetical protein